MQIWKFIIIIIIRYVFMVFFHLKIIISIIIIFPHFWQLKTSKITSKFFEILFSNFAFLAKFRQQFFFLNLKNIGISTLLTHTYLLT
jgi:hypothetical protein